MSQMSDDTTLISALCITEECKGTRKKNINISINIKTTFLSTVPLLFPEQ